MAMKTQTTIILGMIVRVVDRVVKCKGEKWEEPLGRQVYRRRNKQMQKFVYAPPRLTMKPCMRHVCVSSSVRRLCALE